MTTTEKRLIIANLFKVVSEAKSRVGISSLGAFERIIAQLRAKFTDDAASIDLYELKRVYTMMSYFRITSPRELTFDSWLQGITSPTSVTITGKLDGTATLDGTLILNGNEQA